MPDERIITLPGQWVESANTIIPAPPVPGQFYRNAGLGAPRIRRDDP